LGFALLVGCASQSELPAQPVASQQQVVAPQEPAAAALPSAETLVIVEPTPVITAEPEIQLPPANLWRRVREGFELDHSNDSVAVEDSRNWYIKHPEYIERVAKRAGLYMFYVVDQLDKKNMPLELALLPVVESAYDPFAYSGGFAAGMWQFIPGTGESYGLAQNWWYDGRRDVIASTDAAIRFLEYLGNHYDGDWELALAAYNSGMGRVDRAIRHNKKLGQQTDFWSLSLPKETRGYVPKLIAFAQLVAEPEKYGVELMPIANQPYFAIVEPGYQLKLDAVAEYTGLSVNLLRRLNPGYNRSHTSPRGPHTLVVPLTHADMLRQGVGQLAGASIAQLKQHKVSNGDTLWGIARSYNVSVEQLLGWNNMDSNQPLQVGQQLAVAQKPDTLRSSDAASTRRVGYKVRNGDSLHLIADRFNVSVPDILGWNSLRRSDFLQPGQSLTLFVDVTRTSY
jgi:membrane-bound lytic murein transglycosylase D